LVPLVPVGSCASPPGFKKHPDPVPLPGMGEGPGPRRAVPTTAPTLTRWVPGRIPPGGAPTSGPSASSPTTSVRRAPHHRRGVSPSASDSPGHTFTQNPLRNPHLVTCFNYAPTLVHPSLCATFLHLGTPPISIKKAKEFFYWYKQNTRTFFLPRWVQRRSFDSPHLQTYSVGASPGSEFANQTSGLRVWRFS